MKNRLEFKLDLLTMEGQGFNRSEIVQQLSQKHSVSTKLVYYYLTTRARWQPEILGLEDAKDAYHQTLNRLEFIYRHFSLIAQTAPENSNKVGALKGMLATITKKAELTGVLTPTGAPMELDEDLDHEVFEHLTVAEREIIGRATYVYLTKRQEMEERHKPAALGDAYANRE